MSQTPSEATPAGISAPSRPHLAQPSESSPHRLSMAAVLLLGWCAVGISIALFLVRRQRIISRLKNEAKLAPPGLQDLR